LKRSKTDQAVEGRDVGIPYGSTPATCPVRALTDWLVVLKADKGPVFRVINRHSKIFAKHLSAKAVARVVKRLTAGRESRGIFQGTR
jgi:hypothetical protein